LGNVGGRNRVPHTAGVAEGRVNKCLLIVDQKCTSGGLAGSSETLDLICKIYWKFDGCRSYAKRNCVIYYAN
jgi:hypothetical protein